MKTIKNLVHTYKETAKRKRAKGNDLNGVCKVAFYMASRDNKSYTVGATAYGYKIGCFPSSQAVYKVYPNGEVYSIVPESLMKLMELEN